jgi:hypothetical protein
MGLKCLYLSTVLVIALFCLNPAIAESKNRYEYEDCILEHLDHAKLDVASRFIAEACEENYGSGPSRVIMSGERRYNECLLDHMVGVESVDAVIRIRRACEKKYR